MPSKKMSSTLVLKKELRKAFNRGPDHFGVYTNDELALTLCHARLSIVELSDLANQPMVSASGRYVIILMVST